VLAFVAIAERIATTTQNDQECCEIAGAGKTLRDDIRLPRPTGSLLLRRGAPL